MREAALLEDNRVSPKPHGAPKLANLLLLREQVYNRMRGFRYAFCARRPLEAHHIAGVLHDGELEPITDAEEGQVLGTAMVDGARASGGRSALAAQTAQEMGLSSVANLAGGLIAWKEAEGPVKMVTVSPRRS